MRRKKQKRRFALFLFLTALLLIACVAVTEMRIRPVLSAVAESRAKNIATEAVNDAVWQVLCEKDVQYESLVTLTKDENDKVTAISVDSVNLNTICAEIRRQITDYFKSLSEIQIGIPIGSLTGIDMLAGRGPSIHIGITLSGSAVTTIENDFQTAGINQTRHQMILTVNTKVYVIMQSGNFATEISNSIVVAETVIVGDIPEIYSDGSDDLWQNLMGYE